MTTLSAKLVVVLWLVCMQAAALVMVEGKASVSITNKLEQMVRVHCQSGDDDLDRHELDPNRVYEFFFTPNIWGNTRFACDFDSDAYGKGSITAWEGWLWMSRHITCSRCLWVVTPTGFRCNGEYYYSWRPW